MRISKTSKQLFPAINKLYTLGFTDKDVKTLCSFPDSLLDMDLKKDELEMVRDGNDNRSQATPLFEDLIRDLSIAVRTKTTVGSASGKATYGSRELEFFKIDQVQTNEDSEDDEEKNELLLQRTNTSGFILSTTYFTNEGIREQHGILIKNLTKKSLPKLELFRTIIRLLKHEGDDALFPAGIFPKRVFRSVSDLYSYLRVILLDNLENTNRFLRSYVKTNAPPGGYRSDISSFLKKIFPGIKHQHFDPFAKKNKSIYDIYSSSRYLRLITDVFEIGNFRFLLTMAANGHSRYSYSDDSPHDCFRLQVVPHTDPMFDYVDVGRLFLAKNKGVNFHNYEQEGLLGSAILTEQMPILPRDFVLEDFVNRLASAASPELLDSNDLLLITKRHEQRAAKAEADDKQKEMLRVKIKEKIKVLDGGGKLTINEVTYTRDCVSYEGQKLTFNIPDHVEDREVKNWVHTILIQATDYHDLDRVTFDNILGRFLDHLASKQDYSRYSKMFIRDKKTGWKTLEGSIGDVTFKIEIRSLTNTDGISSERTYVNSYRINREEIRACVERGLCFVKQSDFDYFLKEVSKCSLKFHRYLQTGVDISPFDNFEQAELSIKLVIERRKNLNYLSVADKLYKIKDTQKVIKLKSSRDLMDVVNVLMNPSIIEGVQIDDIKVVIDGAKKAFITAVEKSRELLEHAEKMFGITIAKHRMDNGSTIEGYLINGQKKTYVLELKEGSDGRNGVYDYPSGHYICIVDKSKSQIGADKIVNRIFALHNDSKLATQVSTL